MRTKILLLGVAALAAGLITTQAQPVYSANVVGYVNLTNAAGGFVCLNNPLNYIDASGLTNNAVTNLFGTNLPVGSKIQIWNPASGFVINGYAALKSGNAWQNPGQQLPPGQGFFLYYPSNNVQTITFVGTVEQGGLTNPFITGGGFSLIGGQFPVTGGITTTYGYQPSIGDKVETWGLVSGIL